MFISRMSRDGRSAEKLLTKVEARRIALNIAKLPELLLSEFGLGPSSKREAEEDWGR
jgi:hypothetical protein